jgi:hypothetical protein
MKRIQLLIIILVSTNISIAQVAINSYRLHLSDKNNNYFSIDRPEEFLTQEAINRRIQQNINIQLNDLPISQPYIDSLSNLGLVILNKSKWLNTIVVHTTDQELIDTITNIGFINSKQKTASFIKPPVEKKSFDKKHLTILSNNDEPLDYGFATTQISMLNGHVLHQSGYKGQGITIAVIDAGFLDVDLLPAFDSLWLYNQILGTRDFVDGDDQVFDASSHGMKVLSTMGGNIPGELLGTAPKAKYWLLRSEDVSSEYSIEEDNWAAAAEFADSVGADIITSSLGYSEFDDSSQNYTYADMDGNTTFITKAADLAASKGILVLNSAGNAGDTPWKYITAPADGDSVFTIGAVDAFASYVSFSGNGPTSDGRIKPNIAAMGYQVAVQSIDGSITSANGTSFSTPIMAGMAACLWQYYPDLNNMEIIHKIEESAHQYSNPNFNVGYGIPDFGKAANLINTDIHSFTEEMFLKIFPNPFYSYINIELLISSNEKIDIELYSIMGEKVQQSQLLVTDYNNIEITNLEDLPTGIYLIKIKIGNTTIQKRVCKIN